MTSLQALFAPATLGTESHLSALDRLRERGDVVEVDVAPGHAPIRGARRTFVATGHDAVVALSSHPALRSGFGTGLLDVAEADPRHGVPYRALNTSDGAAHALLRAAVAPAFVVDDALRSRAATAAAVAVGDLARRGPRDALELTGDVVLAALAPRLGADDDVLVAARALARQAAFSVHDAPDRAAARATLVAVDEALVTLGHHALTAVTSRGAVEDDDASVVGRVRRGCVAGEVERADAAWLLRLVFLTSFVTTELGGARLLTLLAGDDATIDDDVRTALRSGEPGTRDRFVAEVLRVQAPVARFGRVAVDDVVVGDVVIPRGARVVLSFAGASHDPRRFPQPRRHDLQRAAAPTLAFGAGPHACAGAGVAFAVLRALLDAVLAGPALVADGSEVLRSDVNRGLRRAVVAAAAGVRS
jgi:cytochrome P450